VKDFVRNFISVYGNDAVQATHREVIRRLRDHPGEDPLTHIGEVLYGLPGKYAQLGRRETNANWVRYTNDYGDDEELGIDSGGNTPDQLLNHIAWFYSKVDPECVLANRYDHFNTDFVGGSFRIVHKNKIRNFEKFRHTTYIISQDPDSSDEDDDSIEHISWEQFWDIKEEVVKEAREMMLSEFPAMKKYFS
jgi:hypothetical protein